MTTESDVLSVTDGIADDVSLEHVLVSYNKSDFHKLGLDIYKTAQYSLIPEWTLYSYLVCIIGIGVILNLIICLRYIMSKDKKGFYTLIVQIALSDLISLTIVSVPELWTHQSGNWNFGSITCRFYSTLEVFACTSNIYFLVALNLHTLASVNATKKGRAGKGLEEELLEDATELRSSRHSLVSRGNTLSINRPINVGHRSKRPNIPVLLPVIFVWILSASLSVPEFPLSTVIDSRSGISMCTFLNNYHVTTMQVLLSVFHLLIPFLVLSCTSGMIIYKLQKTGSDELARSLKVALFLCCVLLVFATPRLVLIFIHGLWSGKREGAVGIERFIFPPLNYHVTPRILPMALSLLYFMSPVVKTLGYIYFFRKSSKSVSWCARNKSEDSQ